MAAPIDLRNDFDSVSLRRLAKRTRDATQSRRLLALAEVYDGGSRTDASRIGGVGLQIIRDWVLRFNARGPDGLVDGKSPGAPVNGGAKLVHPGGAKLVHLMLCGTRCWGVVPVVHRRDPRCFV